MGGAADGAQRSSSPLKRPASDLEADVPSSQRDDVDMIEMPSAVPTKEEDSRQRQLPSPDDEQDGDASKPTAEPAEGAPLKKSASTEIPPIDTQIKTITTICQADEERQLQEGDEAFVVSRSWLNGVISHGSEARKASKIEPIDELGPIDNTDIIKEVISYSGREDFVQLKDGFGSEQFALFPQEAWQLVMEWYGLKSGQIPITRFAHNTNYDPNGIPQVQWEYHPLVFKLHRLYSDNGIINIPQLLTASHPAPPKLVFSRSSKYLDFLRTIKEVAKVKKETKIKLWRIPRLQPAAETATAAINTTTPPASRPSSPSRDELIGPVQRAPQDTWEHMLLDVPSFTPLERGTQREMIDLEDVSANANYNGSRNLDMVGFGTDESIVIDEYVTKTEYISNYRIKEAKSADKTLAPSIQNNSGRNSPAPGPMTRGRSRKTSKPQGAVGLQNLGNTCYMNSALQCVRSVEELTKYFLSGTAEKELYKDNPLGFHGEIAMSYDALLKSIYTDSAPNSISPRHFKSVIGRFAPSFSGYGQQDSQEFLGFLLDGLQEDLSRVKKKPYIEKPDSTDEMVNDPEAIREMAAKVWDITKKRDDSVIADLFTGMYKSTLVCPHCQKVSITFDPFNNLTLQLPIENPFVHKIRYHPLNAKPVEMSIDVDKNASCGAIKVFVSNRVNVPVENLMMIEMFSGKLYKVHENYKSLTDEIQQNDHIFVYELEAKPTNWPCPKKDKRSKQTSFSNSLNSDDDDIPENWSDPMADRMVVPVLHRHPSTGNSRGFGNKNSWNYPSMPHFIMLTPEEARSEDIIKRKILEKVKTFTTSNEFDDDLSTDASVSDSTDADMVITTGSDADSSGDSKVIARSVDGEDGIVDVAMKVPAPKSEPLFPVRRPKFIDPNEHLPASLQNMFEVGYYTDGKSMIMTGYQTFPDGRSFPTIGSRAPRLQNFNDEDGDAYGDADTDSPTLSSNSRSQSESSADGLGSNGVSTTTRMVDESSDEDEAVPPPIRHKLQIRPAFSGAKVGPGKRGGKIKTYSKKQQRADLKAEKKKKRQFLTNSPPSEPESSDEGPLVRLGECLIVDWQENAWDALFGSDGPDDHMRGKPTFTNNVPFLDDPALVAKRTARAQRKKNGITLEDCLDEFGKEEILSEQDTWYCPRCKEHRRASKKFELWKTPDILVMHLKRFSSSGMRRDKVDVLVQFPIEGLDLSSRAIETEDGKTEIYDLFAVDDHWGGLGGGHYTAFAKNFIDGEWWEYNDASAFKISNPSKVVSASAYLLFYRRRSSVPLGGARFQEIFQEYNKSFDPPSEEEASESGEDQSLVGNSSLRGSSSALNGVGAVPQPQGQNRGSAESTDLPPKYQENDQEDTGLFHDEEANDNDYTIRPSIEDEGIDMGSEYGQQIGLLPRPSWGFAGIDDHDFNSGNNMIISGTGSDAGSDMVQHNSSASETSLRNRHLDFDDAPLDKDYVDHSFVPDMDEEDQAAALGLQADLLENMNRRPSYVIGEDERLDVEEPVVDIHVGGGDEGTDGDEMIL